MWLSGTGQSAMIRIEISNASPYHAAGARSTRGNTRVSPASTSVIARTDQWPIGRINNMIAVRRNMISAAPRSLAGDVKRLIHMPVEYPKRTFSCIERYGTELGTPDLNPDNLHRPAIAFLSSGHSPRQTAKHSVRGKELSAGGGELL